MGGYASTGKHIKSVETGHSSPLSILWLVEIPSRS